MSSASLGGWEREGGTPIFLNLLHRIMEGGGKKSSTQKLGDPSSFFERREGMA